MNKGGRSEIEMGFGIIIFVLIMGVFIFQGVFSQIISSFGTAFGGDFGLLLGILFVLIIAITFFEKLLGK